MSKIVNSCFLFKKICIAQELEQPAQPIQGSISQVMPDLTEKDVETMMKFKPALGRSFWIKYIEMAYGVSPQKDKTSVMKVADSMAKVMRSESGLNPAAVAYSTKTVNGQTTKYPVAKGMNGFLKNIFQKCAALIGRTDVTWEDYDKLSAEEQLPFLGAYFKMVGVSAKDTATSVYVKNFGGYHGSNPKINNDQVLYASKGVIDSNPNKDKFPNQHFQNTAYEQNKVFDVVLDNLGNVVPDPNDPTKPKRKGYITPKDLEAAHSGKIQKFLAQVAKNKSIQSKPPKV